MRTSIIWRSLLATLLILFTTACNSSSSQTGANLTLSSECQTIQHELEETEVCGQPQRVIALDPHSLDILLSLNVQPIGYAEVDRALTGVFNLGAPMTQVKYLGDRLTASPAFIGTRNAPSLEAILSLKPDLIVGEGVNPQNYSQFSRIAPTLVFKGAYADDWQDNIQEIAKAFDREEQAQQVIAEHYHRIETAKSKLAPLIAQKRLLFIHKGTESTFTAFTTQDYAGSLLEDLGFQLLTVPNTLSSATNSVTEQPQISIELMPQLEADIIIVAASGKTSVQNAQQEWQQNSILRSLPAYQNNQVYFVDYHLWSRIRGAIAAELIIEQVQSFLLASNQ